jgi:hypothetical protein
MSCVTQTERGARKNVREAPRMTDDCLETTAAVRAWGGTLE